MVNANHQTQQELRNVIAQNIKHARKRLFLTQETLAEKSGLAVQTINAIEGCRLGLSDTTAIKLAECLEIEVYLLYVPLELQTAPTEAELDELSKLIQEKTQKAISQCFRDYRRNKAKA